MEHSAGQAEVSVLSFPYTTVAILGGTGSLGLALTHYLLTTYPYLKIRVFSRGEHRQAAMRAQFPEDRRLSFLIGDVRDFQRLRVALKGCDLVVHAAAIKRIDVAEYNPWEAIATNVTGTWQVLQAAMDAGVQQVVTISSDKACRAETLYGSSKYVAERLTTMANHYSGDGARSCAVRYGNVAGSAGSVIPLWSQYQAVGAPLPVTHPQMTRFWLSMDEAVRLVCFVAAQQSRGGLFIPHLPAFHVTDLARAMLNLPEGATLQDGRHVTLIGVRGSEKIHEDLATTDELGRASWYAPSAQVPVTYLVPPALQYWEAPAQETAWRPPPAPCLTGSMAGGAAAPLVYNSGTWPWRLGVEDLRQRLACLGDIYAPGAGWAVPRT